MLLTIASKAGYTASSFPLLVVKRVWMDYHALLVSNREGIPDEITHDDQEVSIRSSEVLQSYALRQRILGLEFFVEVLSKIRLNTECL